MVDRAGAELTVKGIRDAAGRLLQRLGPSHVPIVLVALLGGLVTWLVFLEVTHLELQRAQGDFRDAARDRFLVIQREIHHALDVVQDMGSFIEASDGVGRRQFREFVEPALKRNPAIQSLEWVPRVAASDLDRFLDNARRSLPGFRLTERTGAPAAERTERFPVLYVQPYPRNRHLLGLDLASDPAALAAIETASRSGAVQVVAGYPAPGEDAGHAAFAVYLPLYRQHPGIGGEEADDLASRSPAPGAEPFGFAVGVFRIGALVQRGLSSLSPGGIDIRVSAPDGAGQARTLFLHRSRVRGDREDPDPGPEEDALAEQIEVAGRSWAMAASPVPGHFQPVRTTGRVVLLGGTAFTVLFLVYLSTLVERAEQVKRLVAQRTLELEQANRALNRQITERHRAEEALQTLNATLEQRVAWRTVEAERRARELEQFAYVASHDLKAPLRAISNLAGWLEEDLSGGLTDTTREQLQLMRDRVARMHALVDGLLAYSRIGRTEGAVEYVDTGELVAETLDSLAPPAGFTVDVATEMPALHANRLHLGQVFANLIGNSLRHHDRDRGEVRVSGRDLGGRCEFSVEDDGPGIAPEYHEKVFKMFQTLQVRDHGSNTGIGLALVKKIVEDNGGSIRLTSGPGRGTTVTFSWIKEKPPGVGMDAPSAANEEGSGG